MNVAPIRFSKASVPLFGTDLSVKLLLEFLIGGLFGEWPSQVRRPKTLQRGSDR